MRDELQLGGKLLGFPNSSICLLHSQKLEQLQTGVVSFCSSDGPRLHVLSQKHLVWLGCQHILYDYLYPVTPKGSGLGRSFLAVFCSLPGFAC